MALWQSASWAGAGWLTFSVLPIAGARVASGTNARLSDECLNLEQARRSLSLKHGEGDGVGYFPCPLAGCRAMEIADGALEQVIEATAGRYLTELMEMTEDVGADDTTMILTDFHAGKAHVFAALQAKLHFWKVLPWALVALGVPDAARARSTASKLLHEFDTSPQQVDLHHRLTWEYMRPGAAVRAELEAFIAGEPLSLQPKLAKLVMEFRLIPVAERNQEGDHSLINRYVGKRHVAGHL